VEISLSDNIDDSPVSIILTAVFSRGSGAVQDLTSQDQQRILVVDDEPTLLSLLKEHLSRKYEVCTACSGPEALAVLEKEPLFDLLISDINMPGIMGYELLEKVRSDYPKMKTALITAWSVQDFINNVMEYNIGNIISKTVPFNFQELDSTVEKILSEDIFGLARYLEPDTTIDTLKIQSYKQIEEVRQQVITTLLENQLDEHRLMVLQLMLDESISNAAYHAHGIKKGSAFELPGNQAVVIDFGKDKEKIGLGISDQVGKLTQQMILERLAESFHPTDEILVRPDGRGLFLMHRMVDRLIINIHRGVKTEVILLLYTDRKEQGHRPLLIHEI